MRKLFLIGDLHRNFEWLSNNIMQFEESDVILLGDIEFQFKDKNWLSWFNEFNKILSDYNIHLYGIRGNHDNPFFWFDQNFKFSNIHLVKDYTVLDLKYRILCVGGATSIDRLIKGSKYFKEEEFVYDEDFCNNVKDIDVVVTHSAPDFCHPRGFDNAFLQTFYDIDKDLRSDLVVERVTLARMYDVLKYNNVIKHWFYGHFHQSKTENIFGTSFKLLQICEVFELQ